MTTNPDLYFTQGCGRCKFGGTPLCKVNTWNEELKQLRAIALDCGLNEESKWGVPVYTYKKRNIVIVSAFKEYAALSFFNGVFLKDEYDILIRQTENMQSARQIRFTDVREIIDLEALLKAYIFEAIEVEKEGLKVKKKQTSEYKIPDEFQQKLDAIPELKTAFDALTPGRQKGYLFYFSQAKLSKTREARVEKYMPQILQGKGLED